MIATDVGLRQTALTEAKHRTLLCHQKLISRDFSDYARWSRDLVSWTSLDGGTVMVNWVDWAPWSCAAGSRVPTVLRRHVLPLPLRRRNATSYSTRQAA